MAVTAKVYNKAITALADAAALVPTLTVTPPATPGNLTGSQRPAAGLQGRSHAATQAAAGAHRPADGLTGASSSTRLTGGSRTTTTVTRG